MSGVAVAWEPIRDANLIALAMFRRHYSYNVRRDQMSLSFFAARNRNANHFVGPGQKMVLLTPDETALFVWRKFISGDGQQGVNCAVFRNEGDTRSSDLIREASDLAWHRWPGERLYTYVNPRKIKSVNPGYCFQVAGWTKCGITKHRKLIILECLPHVPFNGRQDLDSTSSK